MCKNAFDVCVGSNPINAVAVAVATYGEELLCLDVTLANSLSFVDEN